MFYIGFFVGWVVGILSAFLFLYIIRREAESVADGKRVCTNRKEAFEPCDPFYVNVKTGEYDFRSSLIGKYGKDEFARMVAYGVYVNELRYQKQLTAEEAKELKNG